jgi:hypothetical protein
MERDTYSPNVLGTGTRVLILQAKSSTARLGMSSLGMTNAKRSIVKA